VFAKQEADSVLASKAAACAETETEKASRLQLEDAKAELAAKALESERKEQLHAEELKAKEEALRNALAELAALKNKH
jgi:hypothetical protein